MVELLKERAGTPLFGVPYKGSGPMHSDLLGGTLQFAVDTLTQNVPFIKDGKLIGIAVTSRARMAMAPNVPTVIEAGFPIASPADAEATRQVALEVRRPVIAALARRGPTLIAARVDPAPGFEPRIKSRALPGGGFATPELDDMFPFLPPAELAAVRAEARSIRAGMGGADA